jgi:hypothetical protein
VVNILLEKSLEKGQFLGKRCAFSMIQKDYKDNNKSNAAYVHNIFTEQDLIETHLCAMMRSLIIVKAPLSSS